jgi:CorA-like Mg2+ transporter protein
VGAPVGWHDTEPATTASAVSQPAASPVAADLLVGGDPVAPTLIASIYGMNFDHMSELGWQLGYPFALVLMVLLGAGLSTIFKRRGWL